MNKLLSANFYRLKKNKVFHAVLVAYIAYFAYMVITYMFLATPQYNKDISDLLIIALTPTPYIMFFPIVVGVVCSLFITEDFQSGAIRNKIIVGITKTEIYLSNFITTVLIGMFYYTVYLILTYSIGGILLGYSTEGETFNFLKTIIVSYVIIISFSAVITFIIMMIKNSTYSTIAIIGILVVTATVALNLVYKLDQPDTYMSHVIENGAMVEKEFENFRQLSPVMNEIARFFTRLMPSGQTIYLLSSNHPISETVNGVYWSMLLHSAGLVVLTNIAGIFLFKKADIK